MTPTRQRLTAALVLAAALAAAGMAYAPGLGGTFLLDDVGNLGGLRAVDDARSAANFILSGTAGPLGRPLALATFVPQASAWGERPEAFLAVNILLHLLNAALLAWVLYSLSRARRFGREKALFAALAGAAIWVLMPLLASSSLMIVQRMTTLSATFVLLGLAGYLQARRSLDRRPARAFTGMSASLAAGTLLAAFAKENGALLPVLVLALEATLLVPPENLRRTHWNAWTGTFLVLPTLLILGYLATVVPYGSETVLHRDFGGWERLLTEAQILWQYLFAAVVPHPGAFRPFHDDYPAARGLFDPLTLVAFAGWLLALAFAAVRRRRHPLLAFAVFWYVGGHLLESTLVPLELYFEHRNYVPIIGPVYAAAAVLAEAWPARKRLVQGGLAACLAVNLAVLAAVTSTWGNPAEAAAYWHRKAPASARAATHYATFQLQEEGPHAAALVLRNLVRSQPAAGYVKIQELNLACIAAPQASHNQVVDELMPLLTRVDYSATTATMLSELFGTVATAGCGDVGTDAVRALAMRLLENPRYGANRRYNQLHHQLMASMLRHEGKYEETLAELHKAMALGLSPELNMMIVTTYLDAGDFPGARRYIEDARQRAPANPFARTVWLNELDEWQHYTEMLEANLQGSGA